MNKGLGVCSQGDAGRDRPKLCLEADGSSLAPEVPALVSMSLHKREAGSSQRVSPKPRSGFALCSLEIRGRCHSEVPSSCGDGISTKMISTVYSDSTAAYSLGAFAVTLKKARRDIGGGEAIQPKLQRSFCNYEIGAYLPGGSITGNLSAPVCRDYSFRIAPARILIFSLIVASPHSDPGPVSLLDRGRP